MSQELRDLMVRAARDVPAVHVDEGLWRKARSARRRQRVLTPLAAAVLVLAGLGLAGTESGLLYGEREVGPASGHDRPAMPSHVYAVPPHVVGVTSEGAWPLGAEHSLAVGIGAVAVAVKSDGVAVISAKDGAYHLLDLPGMAADGTFRFKDGVIALSPDGKHLAYTWNESAPAGDDMAYASSGIRIVDLTTGDVSSHQVRAGYGVYAHGFSWSPDGRYLAYNMQVANTSQSGTRGVRNFFVERLDTTTGERLVAEGLPMDFVPPAVTDRGTVIAGSGTILSTWKPGGRAREVELTRSSRWRGSVVSIGALSGSERVLVSAGLEYSRLYLGSPDRPESFLRISQGAYRLELAGPVGTGRQAVLQRSGELTSLWTLRASRRVLNQRSADLVEFEIAPSRQQYSFATALLERPTRDFPEPDWPMSQEDKIVLGGAVLAGVAAVGWGIWRRRRRGVSPQAS